MKRTIINIRDFSTNKESTSDFLLNNKDEKHIFELRHKLLDIAKNEKDKYLVCSICNQPLIIAGNQKQEFFFKHYKDTDECPIVTKGKYNQKEIDTIRYNGVKESLRHIQLKEFIYNQIRNDDRFENSQMEKVVKSINEKKEWRKPDVSSTFLNTKFAFEIQLQTTYLNVIQDRESFYKENQIYIMWFFDSSNMEKFRFSEKDIFYANKSNAFIITDECMEISKKENKLFFYCYYKIPYIDNNSINYQSKYKLISIDDLKFDDTNFKVYFFDFDLEEKKVKQQLELQKYPWLQSFWDNCTDYNSSIINQEYTKIFESLGVDNFKMTYDLARVLNSIYSLKVNQIVGYNFNSFVALSNNILEHHKNFTFIFLWAINIYGLKEYILKKDKKGSFNNKIERYKQNKYPQNYKFDKLFSILFPELTSKLKLY
jgi:hypothetical protein